MRIDILTVLPHLFEGMLNQSIMKRAQDKSLVEINIHQIRDYSDHPNKNVDDYQFGGGGGMVLTCEPIAKCIDQLLSERTYDHIVYLTPEGKTWNQSLANGFSLKENIMFICGHYKGIDQRLRDEYVDIEISVGDFVLTGGEIPTALIIDSIVRLIPGVLNNESSALSDSFQDGLLAPPVYTRPQEWKGRKVPEILVSGNQAKIDQWRLDQSLKNTEERRPDLLED